MKPLVSVVTPSHNAAAALVQAVHAVVGQTLAPLEHVIIDDGSTDGTAELLQELCREIPHLQYIHQRRRGAGMARNLGIEAARGRYIAFLDSDDLWLPRKLQSQVSFMEEQECVFSYGDYVVHDRDRDRFGRAFRTPRELTYEDLLRGCPIGCLTAAYNQEALGKSYMPRVARGQDWALWLALTRDGTRAMKYPGTEAVYQRGKGSLSANKLSKSLDMYQIYRQQERIGAARAIGYLASFSINSLRKRWVTR
ncbi:glycosyltransferase family 2 protein [Thioalkalivibrio sp.]|uniref:glycosyltransferase family 2 protein n=1 Tax=Thioalkalivibrio sp. TaxID=2093813 RepID=UPI0012D52764|nr:glycosyltransferase family 2 protein [Thioalkalivibrio sp.]TVP82129.1 MAG: glycosyltransferase family 2 protein [Thioalkalivibrio sp.]